MARIKRSNRYKAVFAYVEQELRDYEELIQLIEEERMAIIDGGYGIDYTRDIVQTSGPSDTTGNMVQAIQSSVAIIKATQTIRGIERAFNLLDDRHMMVYELLYRQGKGINYAAMEMIVEPVTIHAYRNQLVLCVAHCLGYDLRD